MTTAIALAAVALATSGTPDVSAPDPVAVGRENPVAEVHSPWSSFRGPFLGGLIGGAAGLLVLSPVSTLTFWGVCDAGGARCFPEIFFMQTAPPITISSSFVGGVIGAAPRHRPLVAATGAVAVLASLGLAYATTTGVGWMWGAAALSVPLSAVLMGGGAVLSEAVSRRRRRSSEPADARAAFVRAE